MDSHSNFFPPSICDDLCPNNISCVFLSSFLLQVEQPSGMLVEDSMNDLLLFSPDQVGFKGDKAFAPSSRTPKNLYRKILGTLSEKCIALESSPGNSCIVVRSPTFCKKNHDLLPASTSAPLENTIDNTENDAGTENLSM